MCTEAPNSVFGTAQLAELAALLISSAETSLVEPRKYPVYRLLDAAQLVAGWAARIGDDPGWAELEQRIAASKDLMLWDTAEFEAFVRSLSGWLIRTVALPGPAGERR